MGASNADLESYHCTFILVETNKGKFGALLTTFPRKNHERTFSGNELSFVFSIDGRGIPFIYKSTSKNKKFVSFLTESVMIGSDGDGPAIHMESDLCKGQTNACETFDNPILIIGGKKHIDDQFQA